MEMKKICTSLSTVLVLTGVASAAVASMGISAALEQKMAHPETVPPGEENSMNTQTLETGAKALQNLAPVKGFDIYLVGFHPMKEHPQEQVIAHHYCHQMNEDFAQCILLDGNTKNANLTGVEFIISEKLFNSLPEEEKKYWHPHNGEILSGQLVAPGIPKVAEKSLMKSKMNSYGKTWQVWNTGHEGRPGDKLPSGEPMLAWSFNRDGEPTPGLVEKRDQKLHVNTTEERRNRADLHMVAKPQSGVDDLKGSFGRNTPDIPGVVDKKNASAQDEKLLPSSP
jgi:hypothetical protein